MAEKQENRLSNILIRCTKSVHYVSVQPSLAINFILEEENLYVSEEKIDGYILYRSHHESQKNAQTYLEERFLLHV